MWKKLLHLRPLAKQLTRMEVNSGSSTSFWYDIWSPLGKLVELTGEIGSMDLGILLNTTAEGAIQIYRARRHRVHTLRLLEQEVLELKNRGLTQNDDLCL